MTWSSRFPAVIWSARSPVSASRGSVPVLGSLAPVRAGVPATGHTRATLTGAAWSAIGFQTRKVRWTPMTDPEGSVATTSIA